jgi:peptide alpha-N-acetyltransferase
MQILRDLSVLQIQTLNFEGFNDTCSKLLETRPQMKANWLGYAVSFELLGQFRSAEKVLEAFEEGVKGLPVSTGPMTAYEDSEYYLYWNHLIELNGEFGRALKHLESIRAKIKDKRSWREAKGSIDLLSSIVT